MWRGGGDVVFLALVSAAAAAPRCAQLGCPKLTEGWLLPAGPSAQRGDTDLLRDTADPPHSLGIFLVLTNIFGVVFFRYLMVTKFQTL